MKQAVAIGLKIPDNTAYTALVTLRRLGVAVEGVERSEIYLFEGDSDADTLAQRIETDETIFNPNKHRLTLLDTDAPRSGEVWIEPISRPKGEAGRAAEAWRLFDESGAPVEPSVLAAAIECLLCNPAIERAVTTHERSA
jgi:hypothetical protein